MSKSRVRTHWELMGELRAYRAKLRALMQDPVWHAKPVARRRERELLARICYLEGYRDAMKHHGRPDLDTLLKK